MPLPPSHNILRPLSPVSSPFHCKHKINTIYCSLSLSPFSLCLCLCLRLIAIVEYEPYNPPLSILSPPNPNKRGQLSCEFDSLEKICAWLVDVPGLPLRFSGLLLIDISC